LSVRKSREELIKKGLLKENQSEESQSHSPEAVDSGRQQTFAVYWTHLFFSRELLLAYIPIHMYISMFCCLNRKRSSH